MRPTLFPSFYFVFALMFLAYVGVCVCVPETRQHVMAPEADILGIGGDGGGGQPGWPGQVACNEALIGA